MNESTFPVFEELREPEKYPVKIDHIRNEEFSRTLESTYLDHAGSTLYSEKQLESIFKTLQSSVFGNPHSRHPPSYSTTEAIESIRHMVLKHFNTTDKKYDLVFTSGATAAIRIVADHFLWSDNSATENKSRSRGIFAYTQENHSSILGMRESADKNGAHVYCLNTEAVENIFDDNYEESCEDNCDSTCENCLFAYPAQCNFSGSKYPLTWIEKVQRGKLNLENRSPINANNHKVNISSKKRYKKWFVLLDAASFVATSPLDLSEYAPDFVPVSFYKIFGYPTGLGCLLVNKRAWGYLHKPYFGGGTVKMADSRTMDVRLRDSLHEKFEDGTLPFLNIISLKHGLSCLYRISGGMANIESHIFNLSRYLIYNFRSLRHENNTPVVQIYSRCSRVAVDNHGSIVNFNIKDSRGGYVGYSQVEKVASLYNVHLRTGCVCNPGACQKYLQISPKQLKAQFEAGHICGDAKDLVEGLPTGSIRISFGYMSTYGDADVVLNMIKECFVEGKPIVDTSWFIQEEKSCVRDILSPEHNGSKEGSSQLLKSETSNSTVPPTLKFKSNLNGVSEDRTKSREAVNEAGYSTDIGKLDLSVHQSDSSTDSTSFYLTDIIIYPVKSCAGVSLSQWSIGRQGLDYDRQWMIVTSSGVTLTQKRAPKLSLIKPSIEVEKNTLVLSCRGHGSGEVALDLSSENDTSSEDTLMCSGRVCGDKVKGIDCGHEIAEWLSKALQMENLRLVRQIQARKCKLSSGKTEETLSLANESQYLIIHRPSLRLLQHQIEEKHLCESVPEEDLKLRFRPNFVIDGGRPYEEDGWKSFTIGGHTFTVLGKCSRCQMVCVNPENGERSKEPMITLGLTRGPSMSFGMHSSYVDTRNNALVYPQNGLTSSMENSKFLHVGMQVTVNSQTEI